MTGSGDFVEQDCGPHESGGGAAIYGHPYCQRKVARLDVDLMDKRRQQTPAKRFTIFKPVALDFLAFEQGPQ